MNTLQEAVEEITYARSEFPEEALAEFQDKEIFPTIVELASQPEEVLDILIGDIITEGLPDILYCTFNGDFELLKNCVLDEYISEYVRNGMLRVLAQLYSDGRMDEEEWKQFIRVCVRNEAENEMAEGIVAGELADAICRCHFVDMLPEIRFMSEHEMLVAAYMGDYEEFLDEMF